MTTLRAALVRGALISMAPQHQPDGETWKSKDVRDAFILKRSHKEGRSLDVMPHQRHFHAILNSRAPTHPSAIKSW